MKIELRIPTEQFAYIGLELLDNEVLSDESIQEAVEGYKRVSEAYRASGKKVEGLPDKEYNSFIDSYLLGDTNGLLEIYNKMSDEQKRCVQTIKKSLKRIESRQNKAEGLISNK